MGIYRIKVAASLAENHLKIIEIALELLPCKSGGVYSKVLYKFEF